jgi:outer membrane protein assembly factor BamA
VEVRGVSIKPEDPLGHPKAVAVDAEVAEGALYRLPKITFVDNHAVSSRELQSAFPLRSGDRFAREKVAMGLTSMRRLYLTTGHIDMVAIPDTLPDSNGTVALQVQLEEGPQYRMGKFAVKGKKELAESLQAGWDLKEGAVFDQTYIEKYLAQNKPLLGEGFDRSNQIQMIRNCRENSVDVRLLLPGSSESFSPALSDIDCDKKEPDKTN